MTYENWCNECNHEWETDQAISEAPVKECPRCRRQSARRLISNGGGFVLKGAGWAKDGYGSGGGSGAEH